MWKSKNEHFAYSNINQKFHEYNNNNEFKNMFRNILICLMRSQCLKFIHTCHIMLLFISKVDLTYNKFVPSKQVCFKVMEKIVTGNIVFFY